MEANYMQDSGKIRAEVPDSIWIISVYLAMLILISLVGIISVWDTQPSPPTWATSNHPMMIARSLTTPTDNWFTKYFINNWYRWDTRWYLKIAALGYDPSDHSVSFQPLYPLVIKAVKSILGISYLSSALLVSRIFCLAVLFLLFKITKEQFKSSTVAKRTVLLLLGFPSSFFLFAGYTEALYLTLVLSCWYFYNKKKWFWAGILGCLSSVTRVQGAILTAPLLWIYLSSLIKLFPDGSKTILNNSIKGRIIPKRILINSSVSFLPIIAAIGPSVSVFFYSIYLKITSMGI